MLEILENPDAANLFYGVLGAVLTGVIALSVFFTKGFFRSGMERSSSNERAITALSEDIKKLTSGLYDFKLKVVEAHEKNKSKLVEMDKAWLERFSNLSGRFESLSSSVGHYAKDTAKIEGRLEEHMDLISQQISFMRNISDKIEALFRYVDAAERATDKHLREQKG